jgi:hypothetical protein
MGLGQVRIDGECGAVIRSRGLGLADDAMRLPKSKIVSLLFLEPIGRQVVRREP